MFAKVFYTALVICQFSIGWAQSDLDTLAGNNRGRAAMTVEGFLQGTCVKNKLVLVEFKAEWCMVCKNMVPVILEIKKEYASKVEVQIIDMDANPLISDYFEVDALPVLILYKDGVIIWDHLGLQTKKEITDIIDAFEYGQK